MRVLKLSLKKEWYDMIERTENPKREEYREIKEFWVKRLMNGTDSFQKYDYVTFSFGYTKRTMTFVCGDIRIGKGNPAWGGDPFFNTFIIPIGRLVSKTDSNGKLTTF